jgi:hypothetical protein
MSTGRYAFSVAFFEADAGEADDGADGRAGSRAADREERAHRRDAEDHPEDDERLGGEGGGHRRAEDAAREHHARVAAVEERGQERHREEEGETDTGANESRNLRVLRHDHFSFSSRGRPSGHPPSLICTDSATSKTRRSAGFGAVVSEFPDAAAGPADSPDRQGRCATLAAVNAFSCTSPQSRTTRTRRSTRE